MLLQVHFVVLQVLLNITISLLVNVLQAIIIKQLKEAINRDQSTCDLSCHTRTTGKGGWATSGSAMRGGAVP